MVRHSQSHAEPILIILSLPWCPKSAMVPYPHTKAEMSLRAFPHSPVCSQSETQKSRVYVLTQYICVTHQHAPWVKNIQQLACTKFLQTGGEVQRQRDNYGALDGIRTHNPGAMRRQHSPQSHYSGLDYINSHGKSTLRLIPAEAHMRALVGTPRDNLARGCYGCF